MSNKKILERKILHDLAKDTYAHIHPKRGNPLWVGVKICIAFAIVVVLLSIIYVSAVLAEYSRNLPSEATPFERKLPESTQIFSSNGTLLYTIYDKQNRIYVPLKQIPSTMKWSMLAAEDINFYKEDYGINPSAIARAGVHDVFSPGANSLQGASTITQQLVKYTTVGDERTIGRKIQELILTLKIEQRYTKNDVLEAYLNAVPFGGDNYGVEAASRAYFGKDIWNLDLAQCALLAGLPQAPSVYSPLFGTSPALAKDRQMYVLQELMKHRDIDGLKASDIMAAEKESLVYTNPDTTVIAPHFVFFIKRLLELQYGKTTVETGGLKVYTSLNLQYQALAQQAVANGALHNIQSGQNAHNASLVSIDNNTGDILAYVGSANYWDTSRQVAGNVDMVSSTISPGSSIKPFVYVLGFKNGDTPKTIVQDTPAQFAGGYVPMDFDDSYEGNITIRKALLDSRNIPAVRELQKVGIPALYSEFETLGIGNLLPIYDYGLSMAIGGEDISLLDLTHAYTIFPNNGDEIPLRPIIKIYDKYGNIIDDHTSAIYPRFIIDSKYTTMINSILQDYHTLAPVKAAGFMVAGKTGTSQYNKNLLFLGYSKDITTGVWAGNTDQSLTTSNSWGETAAAPIWNSYMIQILQTFPKNDTLKTK